MKIHICKENPCSERDKECFNILNNGFKTNYVTKGDSLPLYSQVHKFYPGEKWYKKIWFFFLGLFSRPKLSKNSLELASFHPLTDDSK